jgi:hypothetical protein
MDGVQPVSTTFDPLLTLCEASADYPRVMELVGSYM